MTEGQGGQIVKLLTDVSERMARVEEKIDRLNRIEDRAEEANKTASQALHSTQAAHHRIDNLKNDTEKDLQSLIGNLRWVWGAFVGLVGLVVTAVSFIISLGGG